MTRTLALRVVAAAAVLALAPLSAGAQPPPDTMSAIQTAVACAPPPVLGGPLGPLISVIGVQDPSPRMSFGPRDLLVVDGGTPLGVQLGQQYFVRRPVVFGATYGPSARRSIRTAAWITIVAVNETTAIATVDHVCDAILQGDYLDPFVRPDVPADAERTDRAGEPDFTSPGRILFGDDQRNTASAGEFMLIDRGAETGVTPGTRFAVYRDMQIAGLPLTSVGEAVVVSTGPSLALVRITSSRDAVVTGDLVVPRRR